MKFEHLDDQNIALFAAKFYENPEVSSIDEFHEDLNRTKYIKRLFRKYKQSGILRDATSPTWISQVLSLAGSNSGIQNFSLKSYH